ncbi:hypothetical protein RJ641_024913 [Dillenia turbinata]|uniref:Uncharacterized protein n=1 Tax=Dillenia turbinata TaxID=194707 RepID=A0AAN8W9G1_9MAGN
MGFENSVFVGDKIICDWRFMSSPKDVSEMDTTWIGSFTWRRTPLTRFALHVMEYTVCIDVESHQHFWLTPTKDFVIILTYHLITSAVTTTTASSVLIPLFGSFPSNKSFKSCCILGIQVLPPTSTISSMSDVFKQASCNAHLTGLSVFLNSSIFSSSNFALGFYFHSDFVPATQYSLSSLTFPTKLPQSLVIFTDISMVLFSYQLDKIIHNISIKVLSSQVGISTCSAYLKNTIINGQNTHIKCTTTKIINNLTYKALAVCECDPRWSNSITLIIRNNLDLTITICSHTRVCCSKIYTYYSVNI